MCVPPATETDRVHLPPDVARPAQTGTVLAGGWPCLSVSSRFPQGTDGRKTFWKIIIKRPPCAPEKCHLLLCKGCVLHGKRPRAPSFLRASREARPGPAGRSLPLGGCEARGCQQEQQEGVRSGASQVCCAVGPSRGTRAPPESSAAGSSELRVPTCSSGQRWCWAGRRSRGLDPRPGGLVEVRCDPSSLEHLGSPRGGSPLRGDFFSDPHGSNSLGGMGGAGRHPIWWRTGAARAHLAASRGGPSWSGKAPLPAPPSGASGQSAVTEHLVCDGPESTSSPQPCHIGFTFIPSFQVKKLQKF